MILWPCSLKQLMRKHQTKKFECKTQVRSVFFVMLLFDEILLFLVLHLSRDLTALPNIKMRNYYITIKICRIRWTVEPYFNYYSHW